MLPFKSAAAEKSQHVDQLIPVEIRLLLFPIIYEMFSKKHYRPTGLEDLDLYKHVLVTNFFKPCFYQPFLPTITIPNKLKLIIQPVLVSAKKSSDWSLASNDIDVVIEQFFVPANQSSFDFDELFDEKYLAPKKAKKKKKKSKNKDTNGNPSADVGTPLDTLREKHSNASVPNSAAHNLSAAQQPTSSYEQVMQNFNELFDFLEGGDFVAVSKNTKAQFDTKSAVSKWLENLPSDYQFEIPFNEFNQKSDLIKFLKQKQAAFSADHLMECRIKTDVPAVLDDLIKSLEIRELQDVLLLQISLE